MLVRSPALFQLSRAFGAALLFLAAAGGLSATARPIDSRWSHGTEVKSDDANTTCAGLEAAIHKRVLTMFQLQQAIDKQLKSPPPSVKGLFKSWLGEPYTSAALTKQSDRLVKEMSAAKELNRIAATVGCAPIDIDGEINKEAAKVLPPGSQ